MAKRITITLDDDLDKEIRAIQAELSEYEKKISYSMIINNKLRKSLKSEDVPNNEWFTPRI